MKIIKVIFITVSFLIFVTSCQKDEQLITVSDISVSQGAYIGIVHVTWSPVSGATHYNIERKGPDGEWISAGSVLEPPFDDYGFGLSDNKLVEGVKYTYRVASASNDASDSPFSNPSGEGWIYELQPTETQAVRQDNGTVIVSWTDPNQNIINQTNLLGFKYIIKRRYENETSFTDLFTTDILGGVQTLNYSDAGVAKDKKAYYEIQGWYEYEYKNMDFGTFDEFWTKDYSEVQESGGNLQANYTITPLNSIPRSTDGYGFLELKVINNEMYAATIAKPALGNPVIYSLNGSSWQNISSSYPDNLQKNFQRISICGDGTNLWVGGVSDSAYVYAYNSGWSSNLAVKNLGLTSIPDNLLLEYFQGTLYALCDHDNKLEVFSYTQNNVWNSEAIIENSSGIFDLGFKVYNSKLYAYYHVMNTEVNSTLRIKHLEGTSWQTDFDLAYDYLIDVHIYVDNSGVIYFTSESMDPSAWSGSVFKVTSTSTAQDMVGSSYSWLEFPTDIDIDDMGNPIVSYFKRNSDSGNFEIHLAVYENSQWKDIAGDFSNAISPIDIESNNGLYFIYGDGTDLVNNIAASFKTIKLTH